MLVNLPATFSLRQSIPLWMKLFKFRWVEIQKFFGLLMIPWDSFNVCFHLRYFGTVWYLLLLKNSSIILGYCNFSRMKMFQSMKRIQKATLNWCGWNCWNESKPSKVCWVKWFIRATVAIPAAPNQSLASGGTARPVLHRPRQIFAITAFFYCLLKRVIIRVITNWHPFLKLNLLQTGPTTSSNQPSSLMFKYIYSSSSIHRISTTNMFAATKTNFTPLITRHG